VSDLVSAVTGATITVIVALAGIHILSSVFSGWTLQPGDALYSVQQVVAAATSDFIGLTGPVAVTLLVTHLY